jgi:hypothetical protein
MKNKISSIIFIAMLFLTACNGNKFEATMEERNDYNAAYKYLKNIRTNLEKKELEPSLKITLLEAADKIVEMGDVEILEKKVSYQYFKEYLERARGLKKTMFNNEEPMSSTLFKINDKKYLSLQEKMKDVKPAIFEKSLSTMGLDEMTKKSLVFLSNQIRKYDFQTFLDKTIIAPSQVETSLSNMEQIIDNSATFEFLDELEKMKSLSK